MLPVKDPIGHLCLHWQSRWVLRSHWLMSSFPLLQGESFGFQSTGTPLTMENTFESDGILFCFTVSLFLNSVALSVLSTSFPTPNPNLLKTAYFLAWIFRHSLFLQRENFHLFLFSSHYSGKFPWQGEERTTLSFSNIFLMFSTPKPNALKYFDSKSIILIRKPRQ